MKKRLENIYWKKNPLWYREFKKYADEEFKQIKGYRGIYFISNYGQVVSFYLTRPVVKKYEFFYGYFRVSLLLLKKGKDCLIHKLVYTHFVGPIPKGCRVIHKNKITTDNYYKNLLLVPYTAAEKKVKEKHFDFSLFNQVERESTRNAPNIVSVLQFDKKGNFIRKFSSFKEAALHTGLDISSIRSCCKGGRQFAGDYQWRYKRNPMFKKGIKNIGPVAKDFQTPRPILQFDLQGHFIKEYPSMLEVGRTLGLNRPVSACTTLRDCGMGKIKTAYGFQWRFKNDPIFANGIVDIGEVSPGDTYRPKNSKKDKVLKYSMGGIFLKEYSSITEAALDIQIPSSAIFRALRMKRTAGGFQWRLKKDVFENGKIPYIEPFKEWERVRAYKGKLKLVLQFEKNGKFIRQYASVLEAAYIVGVSDSSIRNCTRGGLRTVGGFQWRFLSDKTFKKSIVDIDPV